MATLAREAESTYPTLADANEDISRPILVPAWRYAVVLSLAIGGVLLGAAAWIYQIVVGIGVAGINHPVGWGIYITLFVFWVGIAHAGTLISAILYLFRAKWRNAINRAAEVMTVISVLNAMLFLGVHLGRFWKAYFILPYPNQRGLWVNFKSPLVWDTFAINTYATISVVFLYVGHDPGPRRRSRQVQRAGAAVCTGMLSLGWTGQRATEWSRTTAARSPLHGGIATPLVLSVHSVVSWDFALSIVPGWHSTIFAPYFVAGAIFSGVAMVLTLMVPAALASRLEAYITERTTSRTWRSCLLLTVPDRRLRLRVEYFLAYYSADPIEQESFLWRARGEYGGPFWIMVFCNVVVPATLWFKKIRRSIPALFAISIFVNIGMFYERFVIISGSLAHEYLPSGWGLYTPSAVEIAIMIGSFSWFYMWFLIFARTLPTISIVEVKEQLEHEKSHGHAAGGET